MVDCKTCEYEKICEMPDFVRNDLKKCATYRQKKPQTNADRIRTMSDEELAEFIKCPHDMHLGDCKAEENETIPCSECVLQWLKSEVKE